jgi:hypothetical protein
MPRWNNALAVLLLAALADPAQAEQAKAELALMGTVPIYWGEAAGLDEILQGDAPYHWARGVLGDEFVLAPLDYLSADVLADHRFLLMAQPRRLSGEENVALDAWVRDGGTLLLFADPMMTGETRFHMGDRRRLQDGALLSPLLSHWRLEMHFDAAQSEGFQVVSHFGDGILVNLRGELWHADDGEPPYCVIPETGLLAHCVIGSGQAMIVAEAAMLDIAGPHTAAEAALRHLTAYIFAGFGDDAGNSAQEAPEFPENPTNPSSQDAGPRHDHHERDGNTG